MEVSRYGAPSDYQTLTTRYTSKVTKNKTKEQSKQEER